MTGAPHPLVALVALGVALSSSGCFMLFEPSYDEPTPYEPPDPPPQTPVEHAPVLSLTSAITWPPVGPKGLTVLVTDLDANLDTLSFEFSNQGVRSISGSQAEVVLSGQELGEGYGTLALVATDLGWSSAGRQINDLLVDLSPPKITLGQTVVRADGMLELWVGDAWVLGKVELVWKGVTLTHELATLYPATVGKTWDYSLVKFPMAQLPAGKGEAKIIARDAAGNATTETFALNIDADPPVVSIVTPSGGAKLSGKVTVTIDASDPGGGPVFIELFLGGAPAGNAAGPSASLGLSSSDFVAGPAKLVAVARDQAGNETSTSIDVLVE